jgi:hypothetical protein
MYMYFYYIVYVHYRRQRYDRPKKINVDLSEACNRLRLLYTRSQSTSH